MSKSTLIQELSNLRTYLNELSQRWPKRWFVPSGLLAALNRMDPRNPSFKDVLSICAAFEKTWFFQRWFSSLSIFKNSDILRQYRRMKDNGLLKLSEQKTLSLDASDVFKTELLEGTHAKANFLAFLQYKDSDGFRKSLHILSEAGLLTGQHAQANFEVLVKHQSSERFVRSLAILSEAILEGSNAQDNFDAIIGRQDSESFSNALETLSQLGFTRRNPKAQTHFNELLSCNSLRLMNQVLGLFRSDNVSIFKRQEIFEQLNRYKDILFNTDYTVRDVDGHAIYNAMNTESVWGRIPTFLMTTEHFEAIINICRHSITKEVAFAAFKDYVNQQILGIDRPERQNQAVAQNRPAARGHGAEFNAKQSTHTASVHTATDLTAWLLSKKYADRRDVPDGFPGLLKSLEALKDNLDENKDIDAAKKIEISRKINSAQRCLDRINCTNVEIRISADKKKACLKMADQDQKEILGNTELFQDSVISLNQFINWLYLETKDKEGYLDAWLDALYEIERGYNFDAQGRDVSQEESDRPICYGGTANKFCERLIGLSPLIVFRFMTKETINLSLQQRFNQAMIDHCKALLTEGKLTELNELLKQLKDADAAPAAFTAFFKTVKDRLSKDFKTEFSGYEKEVDEAISVFETDWLPIYPPIDDSVHARQVYSEGVRNSFEGICKDATQKKTLSAANGLPGNECGDSTSDAEESHGPSP